MAERLDKVGYALVVTVFTPSHGLAFLGAFALNARARSLGEEVFDSQEAESAGVALALLWILAAPPHVRHFLWFDCTSAGLGASGSWRPPQHAGQTRRLSLVARNLAMLAQSCGRQVCFEHVRAHEGQVWNELADICAAAAGRGGSTQPLLPEDVMWLVQSEILPWVWTLPYRSDGALPTTWALAAGCAADHVATKVPSRSLLMPMHKGREDAREVRVEWTCASYNVCSLGTRGDEVLSDEGGLWRPLRQHLLQSQLAAASVTWIGLQETRLPQASCYESQ